MEDLKKPLHRPQRFRKKTSEKFSEYSAAEKKAKTLKKGVRWRIRLRADQTFDLVTYERLPEGTEGQDEKAEDSG